MLVQVLMSRESLPLVCIISHSPSVLLLCNQVDKDRDSLCPGYRWETQRLCRPLTSQMPFLYIPCYRGWSYSQHTARKELVNSLLPFLFFLHYYFIYLFRFCALMFCQHLCLYESVRSIGTGVTVSCELPCGYWVLNPGPLEDHTVFLPSDSSSLS